MQFMQIPNMYIFLYPVPPLYLKKSCPRLVQIVLKSLLMRTNLGPFMWQQSASAFSVSKSDVDRVCKYILIQPEHHRKHSFADEYEQFLKHCQDTLKKKVDKVGDE